MRKHLGLKHLLVLPCFAAALALGGCGGGGSDTSGTPPTPVPDPKDKEIQDLKDDLAAKEKERKEAQDKLDAQARAAALKATKALFDDLKGPLATWMGKVTADYDLPSSAEKPAARTPAKLDGLDQDVGSSTMFSKTIGKVQYTAYVATTQQEPGSRLFSEAYSAPKGVHKIVKTGDQPSDDPDPLKGLKSPSFPQQAGTKTFKAGEREFRGTYDGAPGKFACTADADTCKATWTDAGIDLSAGWTFHPDDGARVSVADSAFQSFGWWQRMNADGSVDAGPVHFHNFRATHIDTAADGAYENLEGSATYKGSAAGKYAIYSGVFSADAEAGHFTADAELMATFGDDTASNYGSIKGTIDNFMTGAGPKSDWTVTLEERNLTSTGAATTAAGEDGGGVPGTVWEIGGVKSDSKGIYSAQLYEASTVDTVPNEVGGTFHAPFEGGVGQMVGAYAARRDGS